jgi:hypothetical protein
VDVHGSGEVRVVSIVADVINEKNLLAEATEELVLSGGDAEGYTSASLAVYELAVVNNNNDSPDQLGISIGGATELSPHDVRRVLERASGSSLSM